MSSPFPAKSVTKALGKPLEIFPSFGIFEVIEEEGLLRDREGTIEEEEESLLRAIGRMYCLEKCMEEVGKIWI